MIGMGIENRVRAAGLFTGVGRFEQAIKHFGIDVIYHVENAEYPRRVLERRYPDTPIISDVREVDDGLPKPTIFVGGFPCQGASNAGHRLGMDDPRTGLWSEFKRIIALARPQLVLIENVPALRSRGLDTVLADLRELSYDAEFDGIPAAAVGAPHIRDRLFIVAWPSSGADWSSDVPWIFGQPLRAVHADDTLPRAGAMRASWKNGTELIELDPIAPVKLRRENGWPYWQGVNLLGEPHAGGLAPTPTSRDWKDSGANVDWSRFDRRKSLPFAVNGDKLWPTPRSSPSGPDYAIADRPRSGGISLPTAVAQDEKGPLNADWVEWMMGMPIGLTDLECDEPAYRAWDDEPRPRTATGQTFRVERLTACGNSLVMPCAYVAAGRALKALNLVPVPVAA